MKDIKNSVFKKKKKYEEVFNVKIGALRMGGLIYIKYNKTEESKKAGEKYYKEVENARNTMSPEEFYEWMFGDEGHEPHKQPNLPVQERYISDDWDIVSSLIDKSFEQKKDLLWERYKDNIIDYRNIY